MRSTITDKGRELLEKLELGEISMDITEIRTGSGMYISTEPIASATALKSEKNTYSFSSKTRDSSGLKLSAIITNVDGQGQSLVDADYHINELGIYVTVSGVKYLYIIAVVDDDDGNTLPAYTGDNPVDYTQKFAITLSNTANVTVDMAGAAASASDLAALADVVSGHTSDISDINTALEGKASTSSVDTVSEVVTTHTSKSVNDANGVHDIRYHEDMLQVYDSAEEEWKDAGGAGGTTIVDLPTAATTSFTYNGSAFNLNPTYDQVNVEVSGDVTATNAGTYTATFALKNTQTMRWTDMTTTNKTISWSIGKATGAISLNKSSLALSESTPSGTVTAAVTSDGNLSVSSSNTSVATASLSGNTATISSVNSANGTATVTFSVPATSNYTAATASVSVTATFIKVYGVQWDGTATTAWSRTDSAANFTDPVPAVNNGSGSSPFDSCAPWKNITRDTSDTNAGTLVKIPKFWYKWTISGSTMKLQIADGAKTGFSVSPAHQDRGDGSGERDYVYVGAYHCATSTYKSTSGVKPMASKTRAQFRSSISGLGSGIYQWDYAMLTTIWMLYLVEYADWNSQAKIGYGCGNNSATENMGSTDGMTYHTGTNATNRTTYGHTRYRYIEDLWGNVFDWCDGIYFSGTDVYAIKKPASFSDTTGGTKVGTRPSSSDYIKAWALSSASGFEWLMYPSTVGGTDSTYVCDYCDYNASGVVLRVGGGYSQIQDRGLFYLVGSDQASNSGGSFGSRLQKLP